jgi:chromatin assembly factor 1 subunit B
LQSLTEGEKLWKLEGTGEERKVTYLSTLIKHTQAVNVVRWAPKGKKQLLEFQHTASHFYKTLSDLQFSVGELLASAGDDGNVLLWVPSETQALQPLGEDGLEDKETWRVKHMCRSMGTEIYDLAWSPDAAFFITGSMDNVARIYNSHTG